MNLTEIMFLVRLSVLRASSISPKRFETYQRNVQSSQFSGW